MTSSNNPVASAILAVYNAQDSIVACIKSLMRQSLPIELIVVDDGSSDNTKSLMVRTIELFPQAKITFLSQSHGGPALARNLGAKQARSDILLFVDADMRFDKDYVKDLIKPIQIGKVVGTYTTEECIGNWDNVWARCWNRQEGWEDKKRFKPNPPKYGTDFRAILKSEFDKVGGFDHIGYTDTWSLFNKLGVRPLSTKAVCYHKNPDALSAVFRQARWSAKRPYKYGLFGTIYALLRTSFPISLVLGLTKSIYLLIPPRPSEAHQSEGGFFVIFKVVYDWGRFVGIIEMVTIGKLSK